MKRFSKYFIWAIVGQVVVVLGLLLMLSITRLDLFGWIPAFYFVVAGFFLEFVFGIKKDAGTLLSFLAVAVPFAIVGLVFATVASIVSRYRNDLR
jgi:hypothetical protein